MRIKGKAIAVTGGTGMIGQALCRHLASAGADVTALSRRGTPVAGVRSESADILDPKLDLSAFDTIVHGAAFVGFGLSRQKEALMHRTNVGGTQNVLDAAVRAGIQRVLHISSVAAIGRTGGVPRDETWVDRRPQHFHSAYEKSKYEAHRLALARDDIDVVAAMPSIVLGLGDSSSGLLLKRYLQEKMPAVPQHPGTLAFVHLEDVASGAVAALERGTGAYVLSQESMSLPQLFARFEAATGVAAPKRKAPFWSLRALAATEPLVRALGGKSAVNRDFVRSLKLKTEFVADKAKRELGWAPDLDRHLVADAANYSAGSA